MAAAARTRSRSRATLVPVPAPPPPPVSVKKPRRPTGMWVVIAVPVVLVLTLVWQVGSSMLRTEIATRDAVAISRVSLEADPAGSRVDFALVDRMGKDTTASADINIKLREPDGTLWQTTRTVSAPDFGRLPEGGLLAGRVGYSVVIPASDWVRAPRRGGAATVTVSVQPADGGAPFSTVAEERFP